MSADNSRTAVSGTLDSSNAGTASTSAATSSLATDSESPTSFASPTSSDASNGGALVLDAAPTVVITRYDFVVGKIRESTRSANGTATIVIQSVSVGAPYTSTVVDGAGNTNLFLYTSQPTKSVAPSVGAGNAFTSLPPSSLVRQGQYGLSAGAGAGIGVGSAIAGALIALALFLVFSRTKSGNGIRRLNRSREPSGDDDRYGMADFKSPMTTIAGTVSIPSGSASALVFSHKPQPKEDNAIIDEFSRLKNRIDGHVNTYYTRTGGNEKVVLDALAQIRRNESPLPVGKLPGLLADFRSRPQVLRAAIASVILQRMLPVEVPKDTLLPLHLAAAYADLSNNRLDIHSMY